MKLVADDVQQAASRAIKEAARGKYDEDQWLEIAPPLRDALRERQRAALVAYLLANPDKKHDWRKVSDIYGWFLLDVEMSPCQLTSRIKQAISSVQLFVQRCLMGLEPQVLATAEVDNRWREWRWMRNYRVWEANRKIFLYPENWIEPELRDDKTPFFKALEGELLQTNLTKDTAAVAFRSYLDKLDSVARLEVVGMYHQQEKDLSGQVAVDHLHVFGRTAGTPHQYYYRRRVDDRYWTPWERVDLDIGSGEHVESDDKNSHLIPDHLIPIVWVGRLFLIWPIFTEDVKPQDKEPKTTPPRRWKIQLAWSEYKDGKWLPKRISASMYKRPYDAQKLGTQDFLFKAFSAKDTGGNPSQLVVRCYEYSDPLLKKLQATDFFVYTVHKYTRFGRFTLGGCSSDFVYKAEGNEEEMPLTMGMVPKSMTLTEETNELYLPKTTNDSESAVALAKTPRGNYRLLYAHQCDGFSGLRKEPWFFNDDLRTYFVIPKWQFAEIALQKPDPSIYDMLEFGLALHATKNDPFSSVVYFNPLDPMINPGDPQLFDDNMPELATIETNGATNSIPSAQVEAYLAEESGAYSVVISRYDYSYRFYPFYHPYVDQFIKALNLNGVDGLLQRPMQLLSDGKLHPIKRNLFTFDYKPKTKTEALVDTSYPKEKVEFSQDGAYSQYNWELFFHAPLLIANSLRRNQRFEDAQRWFHYIFDPTDSSGLPVPDRYWRTKPFYLKTSKDYQRRQISFLLRLLASGGDIGKLKGISGFDKQELQKDYKDLVDAVLAWRKDPFKPHLVARMRTTAYQKTVVMKYLDNLIDWGDQLFRRDTMESINEATQLYILAADILAERLEEVPPRAIPEVHTYESIEPLLGDFSNALVQIEEMVPPSALSSGGGQARQPLPSLPTMLYFCVPKNNELLAYWDKVADRLFKIRHCMSIEGVVRQLPLFAPPINPALLVKAAAAGMDIGSVLAEVNAPLPHYRFQVLSQKATELCSELKSLGAALLAPLEKRDAEKLSLLRAEQETALLEFTEEVRKKHVEEAKQQIEVMEASREITSARYTHFRKLLTAETLELPSAPAGSDDTAKGIPFELDSFNALTQKGEGVRMISQEVSELENMKEAKERQEDANYTELAANVAHAVPNFSIKLFGKDIIVGGSHVGSAISAYASHLRAKANKDSAEASQESRMAGFIMRAHDWVLQTESAAREITHIDQQIIAAHIRKEIAEQELSNHKKQIEQAEKIEKTLRDKYTNEELYTWMIGQVSGVYFQSYQLAYDLAKRSERAFRHELGLSDSDYIRFGYWDSLKKGLLAGERLTHDLKRMEVAYLDRNRRELEITKHVSLLQLDPVVLIELRETGKCFFDILEVLFDLDYSGHYMRRIKSVGLTIPCVTGPYIGVNCTLTLVRSSIRHSNTLSSGKYVRDLENDDSRFTDSIGAAQSIVTSSGQADSGLFETNLRDERFLPFEGAGVIGTWQLEMQREFKPFDYDTITDVVLHIRYTARAAGGLLEQQSVSELKTAVNAIAKAGDKQGLARVFSLRHEYPSDWHSFVTLPKGAVDGNYQQCTFDVSKERFPFLFQGRTIKVGKVEVFVDLKMASDAPTLALKAGETAPDPCPTDPDPSVMEPTQEKGLWRAESKVPIKLDKKWTLSACLDTKQADALEDILIVCHYTIE